MWRSTAVCLIAVIWALVIPGVGAATSDSANPHRLAESRSTATGGLSALWREIGALTEPAPTDTSAVIARRFLNAEASKFGLQGKEIDSLVVLGDSPGGPSGLRLLRMEQQIRGVPVFGSETRFLIDRDGRLWRVLGDLVPTVTIKTAARKLVVYMPPEEALTAWLVSSGLAPKVATPIVKRELTDGWIELQGPAPLAGAVRARQVWFPQSPGVLIPAWSMTVFTTGNEDWFVLLDAANAEVLWRKNMRDQASTQQARFSVYVQADGVTPADSPAPQSPSAALPGGGAQFPSITRSIVNMFDAQDILVSPNGWIDDCTGTPDGCSTTVGNNVDACLDRDATNNVCDSAALDSAGHAMGNPDASMRSRDFLGTTPRDFEYVPAPVANNPDAGDNPLNADSQRGAVVQAFYVINWFHDRMAGLGFDEPSGNFQQLNLLGLGGSGNDRIAADVQNTGSNNASFSTPADGAGPGRLEMSIFTGSTPDRDSALDAGILIHELTHGMTHRLVGNSQGLLWDPARSMGEGWSDFFALALLNGSQSDVPTARYGFAPWVTYRLSAMTDNYVYGFRRFPYSTDPAFNPLDFADVDATTASDAGGIAASPLNLSARGAMEVHNAGTIWASTLWSIRAAIIADPAGANGNVTIGNETMLQLVVDALKMTPANPDFIDGRDALLAADCATNACANERWIWQGFAAKGLGYRAIAPLAVLGRFTLGHMGVGTRFESPFLDVQNLAADVTIDDLAAGNGNNRMDPGETIDLRVALTNPWAATGATGVTAVLSSTSLDVQVVDGMASYPDIAAMASVANAADPFRLVLSPNALCGAAIPIEMQTTSSLGTRIARFTLRVGMPGGAGTTIVRTVSPALAIPVSSNDGVLSHLDMPDDVEIADLDLRIDQLTHPLTGHLSVMLRAPNGYGTDVIFKRGAFMVPNQGPGEHFVNLVVDDDLPVNAVSDLNQSQSAQAPFTGSWLPAFNGPFWATYRPSPPNPPAQVQSDPVGQLSRLDGTSSQGRWTLSVANGSATLPGTLNSWSLLIKPRDFSCSVYVPNDAVFGNGFEGPMRR